MLGHADALVCPLLLQPFSRNLPHPLLFTSAALTTIRSAFPPHLAALRKLCSDPRCRSNPIAHRVRRKRQRLPPSLLIENASDRDPPPPKKSAPRRFRSRLATIQTLATSNALGLLPNADCDIEKPRLYPHARKQNSSCRELDFWRLLIAEVVKRGRLFPAPPRACAFLEFQCLLREDTLPFSRDCAPRVGHYLVDRVSRLGDDKLCVNWRLVTVGNGKGSGAVRVHRVGAGANAPARRDVAASQTERCRCVAWQSWGLHKEA